MSGGFIFSQISFADLSFSEEFGSQGSDDDEFDTPTDLAISKDGENLYVVDSENNRIKIYELTDGDDCPKDTDDVIKDEVCFDLEFGIFGTSSGRFDKPTDLAIDQDNGDIYVVDSDNNRVQKFQSDGDFDDLEFGSSDENDEKYLGSPSAIAIHDSSDNIYVADSSKESISVFHDNGNFLFSFGSSGSDDDEFRDPSAMIIVQDILYVADSNNHRIQIFELTDGDDCPRDTDEIIKDEVCFVDNFGSSGSGNGRFDEPEGLAFDTTNDLLYVADTDNNRIQVFEIISGSTCPSDTDKIINGVCFVEKFGSSGSGDGRFDKPKGLALDESNDLLYVADSENNRIQILSLAESNTSKAPDRPVSLKAFPVSSTSIIITWEEPELDENVPAISGYKIEYRIGSENYKTITDNTKSTITSFIHKGLNSDENYSYRVYAINSEGTSVTSSSVSTKPKNVTTPAALTATAISPSQIKLSWLPPSETFGQSIGGYEVKREIIEGVYDTVGNTNARTTSFCKIFFPC